MPSERFARRSMDGDDGVKKEMMTLEARETLLI